MNVYVMKDNLSGMTGELLLAPSDEVVFRMCQNMADNEELSKQIGFADIEVFRIGTFESSTLTIHSCIVERIVVMRSLLCKKFAKGVDDVEES